MTTMMTYWTMHLPDKLNGIDTMTVLKDLEHQLPYKFGQSEFGEYLLLIDSGKKRDGFSISDSEMIFSYAPKFIDVATKLGLIPEKVFPKFEEDILQLQEYRNRKEKR